MLEHIIADESLLISTAQRPVADWLQLVKMMGKIDQIATIIEQRRDYMCDNVL